MTGPSKEISSIRAAFMEKVGEGRIKYDPERKRFVLLGRDSHFMGKSLKDRLHPAPVKRLR